MMARLCVYDRRERKGIFVNSLCLHILFLFFLPWLFRCSSSPPYLPTHMPYTSHIDSHHKI